MIKKDKPKSVQCMRCDNYDPVDYFCLVFRKHTAAYPDRFKCRRYMPID